MAEIHRNVNDIGKGMSAIVSKHSMESLVNNTFWKISIPQTSIGLIVCFRSGTRNNLQMTINELKSRYTAIKCNHFFLITSSVFNFSFCPGWILSNPGHVKAYTIISSVIMHVY